MCNGGGRWWWVAVAAAATCVFDGVARRCAVRVYCRSYTGMYYALVKKKKKKAEDMVTGVSGLAYIYIYI